MTLDLLLIGLAITLRPFPIMGFILLLSADKGVRKGLAFIMGWLACLVLVIACVLLFTGGVPPRPHTAPSVAAIAAKLAIGLGLIAFGVHRQRKTKQPRESPAWLSKLRHVSAWSAAGMAVLLQPWGTVAAGALTVMNADLSHAASWLTLMLFCVLGTATLLAMEFYAAFRPARAQTGLQAMLDWIVGHQDQAIVILSLALGFWLAGKAIYQLV